MNYKFLFLVGSAINHFQKESFSYYSEEERFQQTLNTIKSIKEKVPDSYIFIYEGSETPINKKYKNKFISQSDLFLECGDDYVMKGIYQNLHNNPIKFSHAKSMLECRCLQIALNFIAEKNIFTDTTRIFKLTGRYELNDNFDINDYKSKFLENKYVMKYYDYNERFSDQENLYANIYGCKGNIITGLWSFDRYLFNDIIEVLEKSFLYMERAIQMTAGIDIEHSFYHFISKSKIINVPTLGLKLNKGMDGETYSL